MKRRVLFIDAHNKKVLEMEVSNLKDMQKLVGGLIERAKILDNGDELYVNEEGLFKSPNAFFKFGSEQILAGNAYVIGKVNRTGENLSAMSEIPEILNNIQFMGVGEIV